LRKRTKVRRKGERVPRQGGEKTGLFLGKKKKGLLALGQKKEDGKREIVTKKTRSPALEKEKGWPLPGLGQKKELKTRYENH